MKKLFTKLTITLMAAGTLYATTATASANTTTAPEQTSSTLVNRVDRETNLAMATATTKPAHDLTPRATKLATKSIQSQMLDTIDTSSQSLDKMKYTK
ncbi:hypothetical protein D1831_07525 [Lactiplantibacillus garii]|uniref:Extracellular protein n=1 Tax=Lactiplantibacillus garii TaxID=2306423 RepID=A0A3R8QR14_9LACO|nr:hypothetical protein [Lactiplantibacillus garii]RRK10399.1 hypothetical protein D1831_07525 [Lactiplantibacillus garii]